MPDNALAKELETYGKHRAQLAAESEGKYVLISGDTIHGVWDTYEDALKAGYLHCGLDAFFVTKVAGVEGVQHFTRDLPTCR